MGLRLQRMDSGPRRKWSAWVVLSLCWSLKPLCDPRKPFFARALLARVTITVARLACDQNHAGTRLDKIVRGIRQHTFFSGTVETGR